MHLKQLIAEYLDQARVMQVATSQNDQPWVATVYFAHDEKWNLSWISTPARRHSRELNANAKVGGVIVLPHTPGDKVRGLQFQGLAKEISEENKVLREIRAYEERYSLKNLGKDLTSGKNPHKLYVIKPSLFVLFDELNFPKQPRQEYKL